jgi:KUP system potassium uptake protein
VIHTHDRHIGQIYLPFVNWALFLGSAILILKFASSHALGAAYGLAVSGDMVTTSVAMYLISRFYWNWNPWFSRLLFGGLALMDLTLFFSNSVKFFDGGYIPLSIGLILFSIMMIWRWGRKATFEAYSHIETMKVSELIEIKNQQTDFIEKNVILMVPTPLYSPADNTPALLQMFWERYGRLPRNLIFLEVMHRKVPYIHEDRYRINFLQPQSKTGTIVSVTVNFGFMEDPNVEAILESLARHHQIALSPHHQDWIFHGSIENISPQSHLSFWRRVRVKIFEVLRQISQPGYYHYHLGNRVHLSLEVVPVRIH